MSASPRRLLGRAADALDELVALSERYPDARARLIAALGEDGWTALLQARDEVRRSHAAVDDIDAAAR